MTAVGLDLQALRALLRAHGVQVQGQLVATAFAGGRSNLTYKARDDISSWVVRRPPLGGLTPSAHDVAREYRMIKALQPTRVPTATPVAIDAVGDIMGAPVSVVSFVPGEVMRAQEDLARLSDTQVEGVAADLIECLADLHSLDYKGLGLETFGRPEGFIDRQVVLWSRQWTRVADRDVPDITRLSSLLADRVPRSAPAAILHGDYRIDNVILDLNSDGSQTVSAILDWEMTTIGDPLTDVALMCVYRTPALDTVLGMRAAWSSPRLPPADILAERYARTSGRDLGDWSFYLALAYFKLAVIAEGITHRARTVAAEDQLDGMSAAEAVPMLSAAGLAALSR